MIIRKRHYLNFYIIINKLTPSLFIKLYVEI